MNIEQNKIANAIGIIAAVSLVVTLIKLINKKTETKLYSDEALDSLMNSESKNEISNYSSENS